MLHLKPGQRVKVRHIKQGITGAAVLVKAEKNELILELESGLALQWGDELELEVVQEQDALYVIDARVQETGPGNTYTLKAPGEPYRLQRRRYKRIPTRLQAQYFLHRQEKEYRQGMILDISRGGALLFVEQPLDLLSELMLFFEFFSGEEGVALTTEMKGKVIREHVSPPGSAYSSAYSYGVEFDKPFTLLAG